MATAWSFFVDQVGLTLYAAKIFCICDSSILLTGVGPPIFFADPRKILMFLPFFRYLILKQIDIRPAFKESLCIFLRK